MKTFNVCGYRIELNDGRPSLFCSGRYILPAPVKTITITEGGVTFDDGPCIFRGETRVEDEYYHHSKMVVLKYEGLEYLFFTDSPSDPFEGKEKHTPEEVRKSVVLQIKMTDDSFHFNK